MTNTQWILIAIVFVPLVLVVMNRLRMDLAALLMATALGILQLCGMGVLGPSQSPADALKAISGLSQPVIFTLVSLFILTGGFQRSGIIGWLSERVLKLGGSNPNNLIGLFALLAALCSLVMNNLAAGALILPGAMEVSRRTGIRPSKLLIPVAYGSLLGGTATYFTTANIIMSDLLGAANPPQSPLNMLDFLPTGSLIVVAGVLVLWLLGSKLLPDREVSDRQDALVLTRDELDRQYQIAERFWEANLKHPSLLSGKTLGEARIGADYGVAVGLIRRVDGELLLPNNGERIQDGDTLYLFGREERVKSLEKLGIKLKALSEQGLGILKKARYIEIVLAPHSQWIGQTIKDVDLRGRYGVSVVALKRQERSHRTGVGDIPLQMGDSLLGLGDAQGAAALRRNRAVIVLEPLAAARAVDWRQGILVVGLTLAGIGASIAGVPTYLAMLTAAVLAMLLRVVPVEEAFRSVEWEAIFLIAGMYPVSLAMVQTGLAEKLGQGMLGLVSGLGPLGVAAGAYLLTTLLTQVMGGQVTALVTGPITISAAISLGIDPQAVAVATAIGCSASFLTPMAHPVNILMIAPANYRFGDFFRAGWLVTLTSILMLVLGMVIFWGL